MKYRYEIVVLCHDLRTLALYPAWLFLLAICSNLLANTDFSLRFFVIYLIFISLLLRDIMLVE
jgi:hypothetical protein